MLNIRFIRKLGFILVLDYGRPDEVNVVIKHEMRGSSSMSFLDKLCVVLRNSKKISVM